MSRNWGQILYFGRFGCDREKSFFSLVVYFEN